jgi:hypothetical protein
MIRPDPYRNMEDRRNVWLVCDDYVCLYAWSSLRRMKGDPCRCIKHGSILNWAPSYNGMTREQIKAQWKREDQKTI